MQDDTPYLLRGIQTVSTESSVLVSSSKFLNSAPLREWIAQEYLRKNGPDLPVPSGAFKLAGIVKDIQDFDHISYLLEQERKRLPVLDKFLAEGFVSKYGRDDLRDFPPNSLGRIFYEEIVSGDYQVDIVPPWEPKTNYELYLLRSGQVHDLEHIITGGRFDSPGEVTVAFARMENIYKYFSPELAGQLAVMGYMGVMRFIMRTALHYPQVWHDMWAAAGRGQKVGRESDLFVLAKYEDVFHLPLAEAREALGVRGVDDSVDTSEAHRIWNELPAVPRSEAAE